MIISVEQATINITKTGLIGMQDVITREHYEEQTHLKHEDDTRIRQFIFSFF